MTLRPFAPQEFDALWAAVADADATVAVGSMDPELLRSRVATSGQMTERELLLAIEAEDRLVGSIQGYRADLPDGVFGVGIELFDRGDRGKGYGTKPEPPTTTRPCARCWSAWDSNRKGSCVVGTRPTTATASIA
jgi:hypothetical protein